MVKVPKDVINRILFQKAVELVIEALEMKDVTLEEFTCECLEGVNADVEFVIRLGMNQKEE